MTTHPFSDDIIAALRPDKDALRRFLLPYATDERLMRIAQEDSFGHETYFADYRAFFDTGNPLSDRGFIDGESAMYAVWGHYWRWHDFGTPAETALHVALAGTIALASANPEAALIEVCDEIPEMRPPLLATLAAQYRDSSDKEPPRQLLALLLLAARIPELARNEAPMLSLSEMLTAHLDRISSTPDFYVSPPKTTPRWVAPVRRPRTGDAEEDADETHSWAECVYRDLPGLCEGRTRETLMAMRLRLCPGVDAPPQ